PPSAVRQHVATGAALELERQWAAREELRRLGSETLAQLRDARISGSTAESLIGVHGLGRGPYVMLAVTREDGLQRSGWLHHALAEREIPNMLLRDADTLYCFLSASEQVLEPVLELLGDDARIGVSDPFNGPEGTPSAAREAHWALAQRDERRVTRYGERLSLFGPRSIPEAREFVEEVLGPVLAYDREHGTELLASLSSFLRCNRSWLKASAELFVHKQTLVYRIRRVEELTGRKLGDTGGVTELWMALQAHGLLQS
ncbi:MAG: PucR family transcriptional regulator, partial [Solirubrobacteraceae bacterium]